MTPHFLFIGCVATFVNSAHAPSKRNDDNSFSDSRLHFVRISKRLKGHLVATFRSPLLKALDRSVETLGL